MSSTASVLCFKLHSDSQTIRVRVDPEACQTYEQLCGYVEKAWRELQFRDYRLFYMDDCGELCLLNNLSLSDALALAKKAGKGTPNAVPVMDIFVDVHGREAPSFTPLEPDALMVADLLDELGYVVDPLSALRLVDGLEAADQDINKVADSLKTRKASKAEKKVPEKVEASKAEKKVPEKVEDSKAVSEDKVFDSSKVENSETVKMDKKSAVDKKNDEAEKQEHKKPEVTVNCEKTVRRSDSEPEVVRMHKEVSSEKEARDTMVDFLNKSGFVKGKKSGEQLVNNMFDDLSSMQKVADRLMGYEKADTKKNSKEVENEAKELQSATGDPNKAAARELASALMASQADLKDLSKRLGSRRTDGSTAHRSLSH
ncbi:hypothetical protein FOZ61_009866 [Perkinsus olseni]|uniref:PB1 domain-containing protein n=1 Tax=Perkinsus olseni TaxID=32597 RepID=A0A7J6KXY0_PEROL|nr:hypothetical protein FOZ61_009866 [Perkinsus olseni]